MTDLESSILAGMNVFLARAAQLQANVVLIEAFKELGSGRLAEASELLARLPQDTPLDDALFAEAAVLALAGRMESAKEALRRSPSLCDASHALNFLGSLALMEGDGVSAAEYFERCLSVQPNNKSAAINLERLRPTRGQPLSSNGDTGRTVALFTSIAPSSDRDTQAKAVANWKALGFTIFSVNPRHEVSCLEKTYQDVKFIGVPRDAGDLLGKRLPYLDDMLPVVLQSEFDICGLVNADILFRCQPGFSAFLAREAQNALVFGSRVNVPDHDASSGSFYQRGYDYFFFPKQAFKNMRRSSCCFGAPWWDLYLPFAAHEAGLLLKMNNSPVALHKEHATRWSHKSFYLLGQEVARMLAPRTMAGVAENGGASRSREQVKSFVRNLAVYLPKHLEKIAAPLYYSDATLDGASSPHEFAFQAGGQEATPVRFG